MTDETTALKEVDRQRDALADRVRLPWWYLGIFTVAVLALLSAPLAMPTSGGTVYWMVQDLAVVVLLVMDLLLGYATGAKLARGTLRAYPSSRPAGLAMLGFVVVGVVVVNLLVKVIDVPLSVLVAVVVIAAVAAARCLAWQAAGIRKDIREGRVVAG